VDTTGTQLKKKILFLQKKTQSKQKKTRKKMQVVYFHDKDVTRMVPSKGPFVVSTSLFGDPAPGIYKFLSIQNLETKESILVGEGDTVQSIFLRGDNDVPPCTRMASIPDHVITNKHGLEIGGPSWYLESIGLYSTKPKSLDNLHLFEKPGPFQYLDAKGHVIRGDAVAMPFKAQTYDFIVASHVLEHIKNPLQALKEMWRVLQPGGFVYLILPFKPLTFDHRRPTTTLDELVRHYEDKETEQDVMDHVTPELLSTYDFARDPPAGTPEQFVERCKDNVNNRCLHVHVFDFALIKHALRFAGFTPVHMQRVAIHQIVLAQKK
jgi:SAM-dependent methyltransferase